MKKDSFEKRRRGVEICFDIMFLLEVISVFVSLIFKIAYFTGIAALDIISNQEIIVGIIISAMLFVCTRLAHKGHYAAGVFGIIGSLLTWFSGGILVFVLSVLLFIDSIIYLINYKRIETAASKKSEKKLVISNIILCVVLVFIVIIGNVMADGKYIASVGQTLKSREFYKYNIEALSDVGKFSIEDSFIHNGDFVKLKVSIENVERNLKINLTTTEFSLVDKDKKDLYTKNVNVCYADFEKCIQSEDIKAGSKLNGYLYFYDSKDEDKGYVTDYSKMNKVKYLKVKVFSGSNTYKDYYLELK